jgi:subtilisin family serine protease
LQLNVKSALALLALAAGASACSDNPPTAIGARPSASGVGAAVTPDGVPSRSQDRLGGFVDMADDTLWDHVTASGGLVVVGLKAPWASRGIWRGKILVEHSQWEQAHHAVVSQRGVLFVSADTLLPTLRVKLVDIYALRAVRRLPTVDYVQPVLVESGLGGMWASDGSGGCEFGIWDGSGYPTSSGETIAPSARAMGIEDSWRRSSGSGVTIGLTDTGIAPTQPELADAAAFTGGMSGGRFIQHMNTSNMSSPFSSCAHGTLMAGVIAAPRDGKTVSGIAYGASLISIHQADGTAKVDSDAAAEAIRIAGQNMYWRNGGKIIVMAWQSLNWLYQVSDEIQFWYYNFPIFFIAAAGTDPVDVVVPNGNVTFPADQSEVFAVTGVDYPSGLVCDRCHYGSPIQLVAYVRQPTTGQYDGEVGRIGASSGAAAVVAGVAAQVWSRYPEMTRSELRDRLRWSGSYFPNKDAGRGWGVINAHKALGGMYRVSLNGCTTTDCEFNYKLTQCENRTYSLSPIGGDGPYTYSSGWTNVGTYAAKTLRICPEPYTTAQYSISGSITDSSDGTSVYRHATVKVTHANPDYACPTCPK